MTFLEQLQESAGLLGNQIQNVKPFGNYDPTLASDYVGGPMGLIPQNRFVGNQFQMPFPGGQSYTPGAMAPGGYNPLPYTPLPFNQGNVSTTQPGLLTQIEQALGGGGGDGRDNRGITQSALSYQNPDFRGILGGEYKGRNIGDTFTFSRDLPFGEAYDQYGRSRTIGATLPGAAQSLSNFITGGGIVGNALKGLLGIGENTVTPETLEAFRQLELSGLETPGVGPVAPSPSYTQAQQRALADEAAKARSQIGSGAKVGSLGQGGGQQRSGGLGGSGSGAGAGGLGAGGQGGQNKGSARF